MTNSEDVKGCLLNEPFVFKSDFGKMPVPVCFVEPLFCEALGSTLSVSRTRSLEGIGEISCAFFHATERLQRRQEQSRHRSEQSSTIATSSATEVAIPIDSFFSSILGADDDGEISCGAPVAEPRGQCPEFAGDVDAWCQGKDYGRHEYPCRFLTDVSCSGGGGRRR